MRKNHQGFILGLALCSAFIFPACQSVDNVKLNDALTVDADAIKSIEIEQDSYMELVYNTIDNVSIELISGTSNRNVQRAAIAMKKFFNKKIKNFENIEDPRKTFLNTWSLIYRFQAYTTSGDGKNLFINQQDKVYSMTNKILSIHEKVAKKYLTETQFSTIQGDLKQYAATFPISGYFQDTPEATKNAFIDYLTIPIVPFRAVNAINQSGQSMENIAETVSRFTDIAEELPDEIRWQLQVLAVQLQQNDILKTNTNSFKKLAETSERLTVIIEKYPDIISEKISTTTKDLEETIARMEAILKLADSNMSKLESSSENFKSLGQDISKTTEKVTASLADVERSSKTLTMAAEATSETVRHIQKLSEYLNRDEGTKDGSPDHEDSFLVEVKKAASALEKSAAQVTVTLNKIIELSHKGTLNTEFETLDASAKRTLVTTRKESETLVDYIFRKSLILVGLIFFLAMVLAFTKSRLTKSIG